MSQSQEPGHDSHEHPHQQLEHTHQQLDHPHQQLDHSHQQLEHPHQQLEHPHQQLEHPHQQLQHQPLQQLQQAAAPQLQSSDSQFACQWSGCNERAANAETLYDHVCESHIGRKSTNNLNLTCAWGSCRVTVVKRDHITSHIRVHVPLKPHRCEFCGKAFKRPQDLKKHVKTHADDSVLVPTGPNGANRGQPNGQQNGYNPHQQPKPQDYFPGQQPLHGSMPMSYPQHQPHNGQGYYGPPPSSQAPAYGSVSYAVNYGGEVGNQASMQSQKQGLEAIRNLVLDGRNQAFDTGSYNQISNRLASIGGNSLPFLGGMGEYQSSGGSPNGGVYGPTTAQYSLPAIPQLRTKDDLISADQVFAALQTTIYENPNAIAAAGVGQPGAQYVQSMGQRNSHSPPGLHLPSAHNANYMPNVGLHSPQSNNSGTPALTPPSSAHSYTSGGSPHSLHGNGNYGTAPPAAMYPTLPGPSPDTANGFVSSSMAPASALGSQFDDGHRRRYSGGRLHKAQPIHREPTTEDAMDTSEDGAKTPKQSTFHSSSSENKAANNTKSRDQKVDFSSSNLDPALGGTTSPASGEIGEAAIKENEKWVNNCRTVENIRAWLKQRLESNDYESEEERPGKQTGIKEESSNLYPVLGQREGDE